MLSLFLLQLIAPYCAYISRSKCVCRIFTPIGRRSEVRLALFFSKKKRYEIKFSQHHSRGTLKLRKKTKTFANRRISMSTCCFKKSHQKILNRQRVIMILRSPFFFEKKNPDFHWCETSYFKLIARFSKCLCWNLGEIWDRNR